MPTDYFENFLDKNEVSEESQFPSWVTPKNSSLKAFNALIGLEKQKKEYIRRHSRKSHFSKKSDYLIQKSELGRAIGVAPQPLFNSVSYSSDLTEYLEQTNQKLNAAKERRLAHVDKGLQKQNKEYLVRLLQSERKASQNQLNGTVEAVYQRTIENLSLDVLRMLRLRD